MKTIIIIFIAGVLAFPRPQLTVIKTSAARLSALRAVYIGEIGIRESTGHNDGQRVEEYLKYVGLKKGNPWCASFVCWAMGQVGIPNPMSGYCPLLFGRGKVVWSRQRAHDDGGESPQPGDVFGLFFSEKHRIAHVGFIDDWGEKYVITVEGNTNESGSREGDGVYRKRRLISSIYKVARYINDGTGK